MKDWTGDTNSVFKTLGASNHAEEERADNDYYATDPIAIDVLLKENEGNHKFPSNKLLEPSAGEGHLSKRLIEYGYDVTSYDLVDRGFCSVKDFFDIKSWDGSIITNPPYKQAQEFIEHAMNIIPEGQQVVMFLKLQFLEGKARKELFKKHPLKCLYVSSSRILCAKNGNFANTSSSAVAYGWFVFEKGYKDEPIIKWIN